jgi:PAS domain S-box-containing protein
MLQGTRQELTEVQRGATAPEALRERCDYIYRRFAVAVAATVILSLLFTLFLWRVRPIELVAFWQALMLVLALGLAGLAEVYRRAGAREPPEVWLRRAAFGAATLGAGWGFAAAAFFPGSQNEHALIGFVVALVSAGGLPLFSTVWWVYAAYAGAVLLPFTVVVFAHGTEFFRLFGAAVPLLYAAYVTTAWQLGKAFAAAYGLRTAYDRLAGDNAEVQAQLGEQLDSLLEAHREVQAYGRKLSLFSERAPIAVFEVDPRATILDMNPAAENLFGYAAPEMMGRNIITMLLGAEDRERTDQWWNEMVRAGEPATMTAERCLRRDGFELTCEWTLIPLVNDDRHVTSVVLQGRDITQQRASERVRSEFTSTLSHELRTPLTSILGSLQLLQSGAVGSLDKEQNELVGVAERNGQRLLDLINEVLDIEKIESGRLALVPEPLALGALLEESLRLNQGFADRFKVRLAVAGEVPPVTVRADRKRLMQVMTNLLSNAAKFSPPNGTVEVSARRSGRNVRVEVGDRGPGIPEKFRSRIFARFAQADSADSRIKGGSGLGLAISKRLVEMMQGRVGFEDRPGGGTSFFFELPVMQAGAEAADNAVRVLLTEHDTVTAEYLAMVLEKGGYRVDTAHDAKGSKELLGRWQYAAWLLSRRLHDAEDPLALIAEMSERLKLTKIIMLVAGHSEEAGLPESERHGIVDWVAKNDSRARILAAVEKWIGRVATQPGP